MSTKAWTDKNHYHRSNLQIAQGRLRGALGELHMLFREIATDRDGPRCYYCGVETVLRPVNASPDWDHRPERTIDHRVPLSRGGKEELDNIVIACRSCNSRKSDAVEMRMGWRPDFNQQFYPGNRVWHPIFGHGVIGEVQRRPRLGEQVSIDFVDGGHKTFYVEYPIIAKIHDEAR